MRGAIGLLPGLTPGEPPSTRMFANARFAGALARRRGWGKGAAAEIAAPHRTWCGAAISHMQSERDPLYIATQQPWTAPRSRSGSCIRAIGPAAIAPARNTPTSDNCTSCRSITEST